MCEIVYHKEDRQSIQPDSPIRNGSTAGHEKLLSLPTIGAIATAAVAVAPGNGFLRLLRN